MCTVWVDFRGQITINDPSGRRKKMVGPGPVKMVEVPSPVGLTDPSAQWLVLPSSTLGAARGYLLLAGEMVEEPAEHRAARLARVARAQMAAGALLPGKPIGLVTNTVTAAMKTRRTIGAQMLDTDNARLARKVLPKKTGIPLAPQAVGRRRTGVRV